MTALHDAPDLAAIEARAAAAVDAIIADLNDRSGCGIDGLDDDIRAEIVATWRAAVAREITAALRTLAAQHAADVAAASRSTRESCAATLRARAECLRRYAYEATAKADATEYTHDASEVDACAAIVASVAIAAPTGGGE